MENSGNTANSLRVQSNGRIYFYDNVKFLAIVLVVIGHIIDPLAMKDSNPLDQNLFLTIYSIHMPLFIFISGLFYKKMDKSSKFPAQKVIAFILIGIAIRSYVALESIFLGTKPDFSILDTNDSFAWFMFAIAAFYALMWVFRNYNTKFVLLIAVLISCMAGYDSFIGDKFALMRIVNFFPFFVVGYMISPQVLLNFLSKKYVKIVGAVIVAATLAVFFGFHNLYDILRPMFTARNSYESLDSLYNYGFLIRLVCFAVSALFGLSVMSLVPKNKIPAISFAGTKTLQIYFWHKLFVIAINHFNLFGIMSSYVGSTVATVLLLIIAVAITFICTLPIFSFPVKQLLAFGKEKLKE